MYMLSGFYFSIYAIKIYYIIFNYGELGALNKNLVLNFSSFLLL